MEVINQVDAIDQGAKHTFNFANAELSIAVADTRNGRLKG